jgi:hypothetical protein
MHVYKYEIQNQKSLYELKEKRKNPEVTTLWHVIWVSTLENISEETL